MLAYKQDDEIFTVRYSSWILPAVLLLIPPALLYQMGSRLLDGSLDRSEVAGLVLGILLPLLATWFLFEFGDFRFSHRDNSFRWRWRSLLRKRRGQVPLERVVKVRRDALAGSDGGGAQYIYRLVVILDDGRVIPLSRGFSGLHDRLLERIVDELRSFLGHVSRTP